MNKTTIQLDDIPKDLLPAHTTTKYATLWLNGALEVKRIWIYKDIQYRISTNKGEYRYPVCSDISIDITGY